MFLSGPYARPIRILIALACFALAAYHLVAGQGGREVLLPALGGLIAAAVAVFGGRSHKDLEA